MFRTTNTVFLGHRLSKKGIEAAEDKIEAIKSFREPNTSEEVATFTEPLRQLMKSTVPFVWNQPQNDAFEKLNV